MLPTRVACACAPCSAAPRACRAACLPCVTGAVSSECPVCPAALGTVRLQMCHPWTRSAHGACKLRCAGTCARICCCVCVLCIRKIAPRATRCRCPVLPASKQVRALMSVPVCAPLTFTSPATSLRAMNVRLGGSRCMSTVTGAAAHSRSSTISRSVELWSHICTASHHQSSDDMHHHKAYAPGA